MEMFIELSVLYSLHLYVKIEGREVEVEEQPLAFVIHILFLFD